MLKVENINKTFSELELNSRDENGYIDLDSIYLCQGIESREKIGNPNRSKNWIRFNDGRVFLMKQENILMEERNASVYSELIVESLASQVGIEAAHYDLYKKDGIYGVLSEYCLNPNEGMYSFDSLVGKGADSENSIEVVDSIKLQENIIDFLKQEGLTKSEIKKMLIDFQKRMVFDIFTLNADRHTENISFRVKNNNGTMSIDLAPIYDNENSLLLDLDMSTLDSLCSNVHALKTSANLISPKIAIVEDRDSTSEEIWKTTLDSYCEVDEVYDFIMQCYDELDVDKAITDVEEKIHAKVPDNIKNVAKYAFAYRKIEINKVMCMEDKMLT